MMLLSRRKTVALSLEILPLELLMMSDEYVSIVRCESRLMSGESDKDSSDDTESSVMLGQRID
eukprot:scaffold5242_cov287-Chaetoceros_neogracile.AAC.11